MKQYIYRPQTTAAGWTCANCGHWVSPGEPHTCPSVPSWTGEFTYNLQPDVWTRIALALERIADALEKEK